MARYLPLVSLELEHAFFPDGLCRGLRCIPAGPGVNRLERAGCMVRDTARGVAVFCDVDSLDALRLLAADVTEPLFIAWALRADEALFANYTEGLARNGAGLLFFDSQQTVTDSKGRLRMHADPWAGDRDLRGLDVPPMPDLLTPAQQRVPPFGLVQIRVDPPAVAGIEARAAHGGLHYRVRLQARATVWKYYLLGDWGHDQVQVVDLAKETEFDAAAPEPLAGGHKALAIRSKDRIALQEKSERRFQLRGRGSSADKVLIKRLPVAGAGQLSRETIAGVPTMVSEIYVHR